MEKEDVLVKLADRLVPMVSGLTHESIPPGETRTSLVFLRFKSLTESDKRTLIIKVPLIE